MVDEEVVMETIKKMKESGLEDSIVISTLQDIGLSGEEAKGYITRAGKAPAAKPAAAPAAEPLIKPAEPPAAKPAAEPLEASPAPAKPVAEPLEASLAPAKPVAEPLEASLAPAKPAAEPVWALKPAIKPAMPAGEAAGKPGEEAKFGAEEAETLRAVMEGEPVEAEELIPLGAPPETVPGAETIARKTAEKVKTDIAERADESAMRHAATQAVLTGQSRQLGEMQKVIKKIEKKKPIVMPEGTPPEIKVIANELEGLRKDVEDTKAVASATRELMEKILEVNRKILGRLP